ncbi:MAG TPA: tetratricopeptide repeat protein [Armatimonadota bacterium]|nr:tetratricopeptide repeat protein [Armatimonadota bacterium]
MKACDNCKVIIDDGAAFCPRCGRPIASGVSPSVQARVDKLLSEANLHRVRSEFDAAIDKCTEALALYPSDAKIHSVLGDIYESAGNLDEAIKWYTMAVELQPGNTLDSAKLQRLQLRLSKLRRESPDVTTGTWTQAFLGRGTHDTNIHKIVVFLSIAVLALVGFGVLGWVLRGNHPASQQKSKQNITPEVISVSQDPTQDPTKDKIPSPLDQKVSPEVIPLGTVAERHLLTRLATYSTVVERRLVIEDVQLDPRSCALTITFALPEPAVPVSRAEVMKHCAAVASAAFAVSAKTTEVTIRAFASYQVGNGHPPEPRLVLISEVARQINTINIATATEESLQPYFINTMWGSELPE